MGSQREAIEHQFLSALRQATGCAETPAHDPSGRWQWQTTFAGRALPFSLSGPKRFSHCEIGASLGDRPIALVLATRHQSVSGLPAVPTGDGAFDAVYQAHGVPREVIAAALAPAVRTWLVQTWGGEEPEIFVRGGHVCLLVAVERRMGWVQVPGAQVPPPEVLVRWLQGLLMVTDGLCQAFDACHGAVVQTQGAAAAQQWLERARQGKARGAMVGEPRVLVVILVIVLLLLLAGAGAVAALWWALAAR